MDIAALKMLTGHIESFGELKSTPDNKAAFETYKAKTEKVILNFRVFFK